MGIFLPTRYHTNPMVAAGLMGIDGGGDIGGPDPNKGEPTGWTEFHYITNGSAAQFPVYGNNLVDQSSGFPLIRRAGLSNGEGMYPDLDNLTGAATDWRERGGAAIGTGTDEYVKLPASAQAITGCRLNGSSSQIILYGVLGTTAMNRVGTFDPVANTWTISVIDNYPNTYTRLPALCLGGDGNIYGFGGANISDTYHMATRKLTGTTWTAMTTNTLTTGNFQPFSDGFAVPIPGNKIWLGGGRQSGPAKQVGTWVYDIASDTFSYGPELPDDAGESITQWMPCAPLDNGKVYVATERYSRIYDPVTNTLSTLANSNGEIQNAPNYLAGTTVDTSNISYGPQTMVNLPDGRLALLCRNTNSYVSTHG